MDNNQPACSPESSEKQHDENNEADGELERPPSEEPPPPPPPMRLDSIKEARDAPLCEAQTMHVFNDDQGMAS